MPSKLESSGLAGLRCVSGGSRNCPVSGLCKYAAQGLPAHKTKVRLPKTEGLPCRYDNVTGELPAANKIFSGM